MSVSLNTLHDNDVMKNQQVSKFINFSLGIMKPLFNVAAMLHQKPLNKCFHVMTYILYSIPRQIFWGNSCFCCEWFSTHTVS